MSIPRAGEEMVCVAIDKDKGSQYALKWAIDNLVGKGKYVTLLHVKQRPPSCKFYLLITQIVFPAI